MGLGFGLVLMQTFVAILCRHAEIFELMKSTIAEIIERIKVDKNKLGITLFAPASLTDLLNFEKIRRVRLPHDLVKFYSFSNGFESAEEIFRIIPLDEMIDNMKDRDTYIVEQGDFHFAEYMIYSDMWTIKINSADRNDYTIYNYADNVITLTNSFSEFLETFLNGGVFAGLYTWRENVERLTK